MGQRCDDTWYRLMCPRDEDKLFRSALKLVQNGEVKRISQLQIELKIGFNQADRLFERVRHRLLN